MTERSRGKKRKISHNEEEKSITHTHIHVHTQQSRASFLLQRFQTTYMFVFVNHENPLPHLCVSVCVSAYECEQSLQGRHLCPQLNTAVPGPWIMEVFGSDKALLTAERHFYWVVWCDGRVRVSICVFFFTMLLMKDRSPLSLASPPPSLCHHILSSSHRPLTYSCATTEQIALWMIFPEWQRAAAHRHRYPECVVPIPYTHPPLHPTLCFSPKLVLYFPLEHVSSSNYHHVSKLHICFLLLCSERIWLNK